MSHSVPLGEASRERGRDVRRFRRWATGAEQGGMVESTEQGRRGARAGAPVWLSRGLAAVVGVAALAVTTWGLIRHNNWYLASDQFAFLTIARDLRAGQVFHDAAIFDVVAPLRDPTTRFDALTQTFFLEGGRLWSRYPPGFPLLLAAAGVIGGEAGEHALNPLLYVATLGALAWLAHRLLAPLGAAAAAGAAALVPWGVLLVPTSVHLWGITVARDLPAHLCGVLALIAALGGHPVRAGLALGFACDIRPDALLYGLPLALIFALERVPLRARLKGAAAFVVALTPLLLWNFLTQGSILGFGQEMEFRALFSSRQVESPIATAQALPFVSGGAFRLQNLRHTLPANAGDLWAAFGFSLLLAGVAPWVSRGRRARVAAALLPYPAAALVFYSCWSHPDPRYLAGAALLLDATVAVGAVAICALPAQRALERWLRVVACLGIAVLAWRMGGSSAPATLVLAASASAGALVWALVGGALLPRPALDDARSLAWLAGSVALLPALGLCTLGLGRLASGSASYGPFPRAQAEQARAEITTLMPPGSLVIAGEGVGRPVENLRLYGGLEAFLPSELALLGVKPEVAALLVVARGGRAFFLMDDSDARLPRSGSANVALREIARRSGPALLDWFVDPRGAPAGLALREFVLTEDGQRDLRRYLDALGARAKLAP